MWKNLMIAKNAQTMEYNDEKNSKHSTKRIAINSNWDKTRNENFKKSNKSLCWKPHQHSQRNGTEKSQDFKIRKKCIPFRSLFQSEWVQGYSSLSLPSGSLYLDFTEVFNPFGIEFRSGW